MSVPAEPASQQPAWEGRALDRSLAAARDRSSARAQRLVDAARSLAAERGAAEFTVAEVAARADVALRTFYRHFAGRDDLLLALIEVEAATGAELLRVAFESEDTPLDRLRRYVVDLCQLAVTGSGYAALLVREHLRLGASHPDEVRTALAPLVDLLDAQLRSAAAAGQIRPVDRDDTVIMFTAVLAHVHGSVLFGPDEDRATSAERLWAFCRAALLPRDGST